jgi:methylmalonyl-CoA/ethylmalonyl-CoA epimerase
MSKPHVDHIGIIVGDLDRAVATFAPLFSAQPSSTKTLTEAGIRVAEFEAANITVELIEYCEAGDSFAKTVMGTTEGINHLSLRVDNVDDSIKSLAASGVTVMDGFPTQGAHGTVAFFEPDTTQGLLFEICEPDR